MYEQLISKEDPDKNIEQVFRELVPERDLHIVDMGAGTGRFTTMLAEQAACIKAFDLSEEMLQITARKLRERGISNWFTQVADHRSLPLEDQSADLVVSGWSICYLCQTEEEKWEDNLAQVMAEIERVLKPDGSVIIMETLGTGNEEPHPPLFLRPYYEKLQTKYGFATRWIRTDFLFDTIEEAEELTRFFFGDELADRVRKEKIKRIPSCTGVWHKQY